jgi:hydrogenase nickel incorporation protein HypA/HybF
MHEASIATGILETVRRALADRDPVRLRAVRVRIGTFAGVVPECLEFAWTAAREGTFAAEAVLEIEDVPATARCAACDEVHEVEEMTLACPRCGGLDVRLLTGRELEVLDVEVEEEEPVGLPETP